MKRPFMESSPAGRAGATMIIAELGTGHGGDGGKARELIAAAVDAGADCVKFQHVYADEIIHPATGFVPLPGGSTPLYERFKSLETGPEFLAEMKSEVEARGALFLCTPFGPRSALELLDMGVLALKVASPELNYVQLLDLVSSFGLPTMLSSGVSTLADIEAALAKFGSGSELALLHCVTAYPAPESDYNLRILPLLSSMFGVPVGVSDHSLDPVIVPALAVAMGGTIVEKHFCLSRADDGLDDPIALEPRAFAEMSAAIRLAEAEGSDRTIARLGDSRGRAAIEAVLGDGRKVLAASERANYSRTNRSIHARSAIEAGQIMTSDRLCVVRTEKILRPGLHPALLGVVEGRIAARDVPAGEGIEWADLGGRA